MRANLGLSMLLVATALACGYLIWLHAGLRKTVTVQETQLRRLQSDLEAAEDLAASQRKLLRVQSLERTSAPADELLAMFPAKFPAGDWRPADVQFVDCWFESDDAVRLHGWYLPHAQPRAELLLVHGNAGNLSHRGPIAKYLHDRFKVSVLVFDYRGYGRSEGIPTFEGLVRDARAARNELARLAKIPPERVVLLGESLGGAIAVQVAAEHAARGLVIESSFSSFRDVAASHFPSLLVRTLVADKLNSEEAIKKYAGPLLLCHGDADTTIPIESGRKLFDAAQEPKEFVLLAGCNHNDPKPEAYYVALGRFFDRLSP